MINTFLSTNANGSVQNLAGIVSKLRVYQPYLKLKQKYFR